MTVEELIKFLKQFPPDTPCTYDDGNGLEVGYNESLKSVDFH